MVKITVKCDCCSIEPINNIVYKQYQDCVKEHGQYYCNKCVDNGYKKTTNFKEWCYDNLFIETANRIIFHWDNKLNIDENGNVINPEDVDFNSLGIDGKGYWFKCFGNHKDHLSEQKSISIFTKSYNNDFHCKQCNSISITHPELEIFLVNKKDALKYSIHSNKKIPMVCPDCGYERERSISQLAELGLRCPICSSGYYPEKFVFNFLEQLHKNFKTQLNKKTFKWCENYRYDFYLNIINGIIETHGLQHYKEVKRWGKLINTQENDKNKEKLAKESGIENYIVLDCRKSDMNWIKDSIMNSPLPQLLNFKEEDINWLKCHWYGCSGTIKKTCDLWNRGVRDIKDLINKLNIPESTILRHIKQGIELCWCEKENLHGLIIKTGTDKKVELNYNQVNEIRQKWYTSCKYLEKDLAEEYLVSEETIYNVINFTGGYEGQL